MVESCQINDKTQHLLIHASNRAFHENMFLKKLKLHTGQEEGEATAHLWSRLGILLQRGNAAILGNRVPALPGAHIDGIICTAPTWNGDLNFSKWGPNGDLILNEMGTKWGPSATEMGTKWGLNGHLESVYFLS